MKVEDCCLNSDGFLHFLHNFILRTILYHIYILFDLSYKFGKKKPPISFKIIKFR